MTSENTNHGGARAGAGRPRANSSIMKDNKIVERKLKSKAEEGWEVLADAYPDIVRAAVKAAKGTETSGPNMPMVKTLLELMVKVVGSDPESHDSVVKGLVERFATRLQEDRNDAESSMGRNSGGHSAASNHPNDLREPTNNPLPRMDISLRLPGTD